ncbi:MAG: erythromycin esterase family protein, partial [Halobaculum sp.]
ATHGTREFVRLNARVAAGLFARGFRTLALEADAAAVLALDDYLRGDSPDEQTSDSASDLDAVLCDLRPWFWSTETARAWVRWLRQIQEALPAGERVRVRGVDLGRPSSATAWLRSYVDRVERTDSDLAATLREAARAGFDSDTLLPDARFANTPLGDTPTAESDASERDDVDAVRDAIRRLDDTLADEEPRCVEAVDSEAWLRARHLCRVLDGAVEWNRVRRAHSGPHPDGMAERDRQLSRVLARCLSHDAGDGVVVAAHNSHVQRGTFDDGQSWTDRATMGDCLAREFGERYTPVGFDFARGSVTAIDGSANTDGRQYDVFSVGSPPADTATATFDGLDAAPCVIHLGAAAESHSHTA